jgi:hypothetical protein
VIRAVIARTAAGAGLDPARLSFTTALTAIRATAGSPPADALAHADAAILAAPVPDRPGRIRPRALREPAPAYPAMTGTTSPIAHHATYTITITPHAPPARTPDHQRKHATSTPNPPP